MNQNNVEWLKNMVVSALQGLMALSMEGTPSIDTLPATVTAWMRVLQTRPITWDREADGERILEAFRTIAATSKRWPLPAHFLEALPPRKPLLKLDSPKGEYTPQSRAAVKNLLARLGSRAA